MVPLVALAVATVPPVPQIDPDLVTPGPWGFAAIVFVALAASLLLWDMMRRVRRGRYRSEIREELDAEELAARDTPDRDDSAAER